MSLATVLHRVKLVRRAFTPAPRLIAEPLTGSGVYARSVVAGPAFASPLPPAATQPYGLGDLLGVVGGTAEEGEGEGEGEYQSCLSPAESLDIGLIVLEHSAMLLNAFPSLLKRLGYWVEVSRLAQCRAALDYTFIMRTRSI